MRLMYSWNPPSIKHGYGMCYFKHVWKSEGAF
jgi:hypothetical protein